MIRYTSFFVVSILIYNAFAVDLPSYIPRCKFLQTEEMHADCVKKNANKMQLVLKRGIPELGLPAIENLVIPRVTLEQNGRVAAFNATLINTTVHNLWNYNMTTVKFTYKPLLWIVGLHFDEINLEGEYKVEGRILNQHVERNSHFSANFTNAFFKVNCYANITKHKRGKEYIELKKIDVDIDLGKIDADLGVIFGVETLDKAATTFLEESGNDVIKAMSVDIGKIIDDVIQRVLNRITDTVPLWSIFLH